MIRVNLVEDNQRYSQKITYKFDIEDDDLLFSDWCNIGSIDDVSEKVKVWHCGDMLEILKENILSLSISDVENDHE